MASLNGVPNGEQSSASEPLCQARLYTVTSDEITPRAKFGDSGRELEESP